MRVSFSTLGSTGPGRARAGETKTVELPAGATVGDLLRQVDITWGEIGIIVVNGERGSEESVLHEGDRVEMIAPIGGGRG